jgi:solute carrier family 25 (mitochondrial 2-oxodicarboxylate transporter), member 21
MQLVREGGVRQLYRGGLPEITGLMPRAAAALSTLEFSQRYFKERNGGQLSTLGGYVSGGLCGITEGVVFSPFQVIKVMPNWIGYPLA